MITSNGMNGKTVMAGPEMVIGAEMLMLIEALTEADNTNVIKYMVTCARDLNKIDILVNFAKAITDEL